MHWFAQGSQFFRDLPGILGHSRQEKSSCIPLGTSPSHTKILPSSDPHLFILAYLADISSDIPSGILSGIYIYIIGDSLWLRSGGEHSDPELEAEARQGTQSDLELGVEVRQGTHSDPELLVEVWRRTLWS